jgi:hypothetical protein
MADQDKGNADANANGQAGGKADDSQKTDQAKTTYTAEDIQREADRRVNDAQKKWRAEQAEILAAKDRDAEAKIAELNTKAAEAERYGNFVDDAHASGIKNTKAAYIVAVAQGHIDKRGKFDVEGFRKANPEFFATTPAANANAGAGAGAATQTGGMNAWIRSQAGLG